MAATTTTIASSPLHEFRTPSRVLREVPSSDDLPSLSELYKSMPGQSLQTVPTDFREQPFPGFSSARSLLLLNEFALKEGVPPGAKRLGLQANYAHCSPSVKIKRPKDDKAAVSPAIKAASSARITNTKALDENLALPARPSTVTETKPRADRKPRPKKAAQKETATQSKIAKTKITKPGSREARGSDKEKKTQQKAVELEAKSSQRKQSEEVLPDTPAQTVLNVAVKRRRDWTPVKDTSKKHKQLPEEVDEEVNDGVQISTHSSFGQALGSFSFQQPTIYPIPKVLNEQVIQQQAFVKGKRIDPVNEPKRPSLVPEKTKRIPSPTKKATTITDKATAPYLPSVESFPPAVDDRITRFLAADTQVEDKSRGRTSKTSRPKAKATKAKKAKKKPEIRLLSPTSAMRHAQDQELLFGTSSQLARDESPTVIAIRQSERHVPKEEFGSTDLTGFEAYRGFLAFAPSKKLWAAASRDANQALLASEPVAPPARYKHAQLSRDLPESRKIVESQQAFESKEFHNIDEITPVSGAAKLQEPGVDSAQLAGRKGKGIEHAPIHDSSNPEAGAETSSNELFVPDFETFSDESLKRQVASYGLKTIKRRQDMIKIVTQCWRQDTLRKAATGTKQAPALKETDPNRSIKANISPEKKKRRTKKDTSTEKTDQSSPVKRPRGRPRKDASSEGGSPKKASKKSKAIPLVDEDKSDEIMATNGAAAKKPKKPPPPKHMEHYHKGPSGEASETRRKPCYIEAHSKSLLALISKAVASQPPSHDIKNLSWHERILLYDPIVIEDLTDWLTKGTLADAGELDEPSVFLVKDWCESKSVCCVWRETLRGKERARW